MTKRIIEIADTAASLSAGNHLLRIKLPDGTMHTVPISEIECLILANPALTISGALLAELAENKVSVVVSSQKHLPSAMILPLEANYIQTERFHAQFNSSEPLKKRIWQAIVRRKIRAQADLLAELHQSDFGLNAVAAKVRSGDPDNTEALAAVIYWKNLFRIPFKRNRMEQDNNSLLNYGYAILRAMTARAVCSAGLHPAIGVEHHNRYDAFCLADDLMEPYRVLIDKAVYALNPDNAAPIEITREIKRDLISSLQTDILFEGENRGLSDVLQKQAAALAKSFSEGKCLLDSL